VASDPEGHLDFGLVISLVRAQDLDFLGQCSAYVTSQPLRGFYLRPVCTARVWWRKAETGSQS